MKDLLSNKKDESNDSGAVTDAYLLEKENEQGDRPQTKAPGSLSNADHAKNKNDEIILQVNLLIIN